MFIIFFFFEPINIFFLFFFLYFLHFARLTPYPRVKLFPLAPPESSALRVSVIKAKYARFPGMFAFWIFYGSNFNGSVRFPGNGFSLNFSFPSGNEKNRPSQFLLPYRTHTGQGRPVFGKDVWRRYFIRFSYVIRNNNTCTAQDRRC